jgi:hypothetical protein
MAPDRLNWLRRLIHSPAQQRRKAPIVSGGKAEIGSLMGLILPGLA